MRKLVGFAVGFVVVAGVAMLSGCGDSHPLPAASTPDNSATASHGVFTGTFAAAEPRASGNVVATGNCSLDAIDGTSAVGKTLPHGGAALFAGWAASADATAVPAAVEIELRGSSDFEVQAPTGTPRSDVAEAMHQSALMDSGYAIRADLSAVPAGSYKVALRYEIGGKVLRCETPHSVTIR